MQITCVLEERDLPCSACGLPTTAVRRDYLISTRYAGTVLATQDRCTACGEARRVERIAH